MYSTLLKFNNNFTNDIKQNYQETFLIDICEKLPRIQLVTEKDQNNPGSVTFLYDFAKKIFQFIAIGK